MKNTEKLSAIIIIRKFEYRLIKYLEHTYQYLENDLKSHTYILNSVIKNPKLKLGGQGFSMILSAFATLDLLGFIDSGGKIYASQIRFKKILKTKYFDFGQNINEDAFYDLLRNGAIHQLYPNKFVDSGAY
ncbi:MAG: hypothetical protein ABIR66_07150 [Saprospiraceae bacterium]